MGVDCLELKEFHLMELIVWNWENLQQLGVDLVELEEFPPNGSGLFVAGRISTKLEWLNSLKNLAFLPMPVFKSVFNFFFRRMLPVRCFHSYTCLVTVVGGKQGHVPCMTLPLLHMSCNFGWG